MKPERLVIFSLALSLALLGAGCNSKNTSTTGGEKNTGGSNNRPNARIVATFTPASGTAFQYNPPTMVGGYLYLGTSTKINLDADPAQLIAKLPDEYVYKMDTDLKPIWTSALGKTMAAGGVTLDSQGNVYVVTISFRANVDQSGQKSGKGYLTDLALLSLAPDGTKRWSVPIISGEDWQHGMVNCAIGTDDMIYVAGSKLYAITSAGTGAWSYPSDAAVFAGLRTSPIIDAHGTVFLAAPSPTPAGSDVVKLFAFAAGDRTPTWSVELGNNVLLPEGGTQNGGGHKENILYSSPSFGLGQRTVVVPVGNTISKVDVATRRVLWSVMPPNASGTFKENPAIDETDTIYAGTKSNTDSRLYAINADGTIKWSRLMGADMYPSPFLGDDGKLYIGSEQTPEGTFHAIDRTTGKTVWAVGHDKEIPDFSFDSPLLSGGYAYFGVFEARGGAKAFYKVKVDANGYLPGAAWPRFHGGNENTGR